MSSVKLVPRTSKAGERWLAKSEKNFDKMHSVAIHHLRILHQHYGTIEAIVEIIGKMPCYGDIFLKIKPGLATLESELTANRDSVSVQLVALVLEIHVAADAIANIFTKGDGSYEARVSQTLEFKQNA
jgi:hypothetical protein